MFESAFVLLKGEMPDGHLLPGLRRWFQQESGMYAQYLMAAPNER